LRTATTQVWLSEEGELYDEFVKGGREVCDHSSRMHMSVRS
jgi:hypothetical protein